MKRIISILLSINVVFSFASAKILKPNKQKIDKEIFEKVKLRYLEYLKSLENKLKKELKEVEKEREKMKRDLDICQERVRTLEKMLSLERRKRLEALKSINRGNIKENKINEREIVISYLEKIYPFSIACKGEGEKCVIVLKTGIIKENDNFMGYKIKKITKDYIEFEKIGKIYYKEL